MLINPIKFIEKHPGRAAAMLPVLLVLYVSLVTPRRSQTPAPEQVQTQAKVGEPLDNDGDDEPFDRTQCKVYNLGLALGAWAFQYKGTDGKLNYILFTDNQEVIHTLIKPPLVSFGGLGLASEVITI